MHLQDEELLFEMVPGEHLQRDVCTLRELCNVAGLLVDLATRDGKTLLSVRYNAEFTGFIRNRKAGRPRNSGDLQLSCEEVFSLKETDGAGMAASRLGMSVATFYRRCNENKGKKKEEPFV